jgi:hypothetical protein
MPTRPILCPHCHTPVEPGSMDTARSPAGDWWICPACDEPVLFHAREEVRPTLLADSEERPATALAES